MQATTRRNFLTTAALVTAMVASPAQLALAQGGYPTRQVTLVVPFPAGGPSDILGRLLAQRLGEMWRQKVVVENRVGASGTIGTHLVAKTSPDGHVLLLAAGATNGAAEVLNPRTTPYRTLKDFAAIGFVGVTRSLVVVASDVPASNMREFVALVKANPGKYTYANASQGSAPHFAFELLKINEGLDLLEVPFNGAAPAMTALGGGQVHSYMGSVFSSAALVQSGRAKPIGVASTERIPSLPTIPTLAEQGYQVAWDTWYGLLAPTGTPEPVLDKLNTDLNAVLRAEGIREQVAKMGLELRAGSRREMFDAMSREIENASRVALLARMIKE